MEIYQEWHYPCELCRRRQALSGLDPAPGTGRGYPGLRGLHHDSGGLRGTEERTIDFLSYSPTLGLWGLGLYSFLAATLLPGGSEVALLALLGVDASLLWPALAVATVGNTAGGLTSWWCGRIMPVARRVEGSAQGRWLTRWGSPLLLLSWVPFVGDLLCVAAGWLRLHWLPCGLFMALGKFVRYWVVAYALLA